MNRYDYHKPSESQLQRMEQLRQGVKHMDALFDKCIPGLMDQDGADFHQQARLMLKSFQLWANMAIMWSADSVSPREQLDGALEKAEKAPQRQTLDIDLTKLPANISRPQACDHLLDAVSRVWSHEFGGDPRFQPAFDRCLDLASQVIRTVR